MGFKEFLIIVGIILVLNYTGLWTQVVKGLRQLHGEPIHEEPTPSQQELEICYKMLGISPSSRWEEVESAYRAKARVHHPDRGGDDDAMRALNDAYTMLKRKHGKLRR